MCIWLWYEHHLWQVDFALTIWLPVQSGSSLQFDLETQSPKSTEFAICNMHKKVGCSTIIPTQRSAQTGSVYSHFDSRVRISFQDIITPPGGHIPSPYVLRLTRVNAANMWKVRWGRKACQALQGKITHSKWDACGQPNSVGHAWSTPDSSMRDSWSLKQFPLHGSSSLQTSRTTSPHFRSLHIFLFCGPWWMPPPPFSHPALACGHLSGLWAGKSARLQTKFYAWSRISSLCR